MSTFLTLHSKKALFTHGNLTAKSSGENSVELFKVDGTDRSVTVTKDADTIFKQSDGSTDLLKIHPSDADSELANKITSQAGVIMKTLDGSKNLLSLDASNTKSSTDAGLTTKTNVNLQTEDGEDLLILDAVSDLSVTSLQAPYLEITNQFKTSGETELDGAVNISGVTTVDNKLNVNGTIDINGGDLILDENSQLIVAGGSELNVIGDEGIHWFNGGLTNVSGGYAPRITIGGASVADYTGDYVRKTGVNGFALPKGTGTRVFNPSTTVGENIESAPGILFYLDAQEQLDFVDHIFYATTKEDDNGDYVIDHTKGEYYWNKDKGACIFKQNMDWLDLVAITVGQNITLHQEKWHTILRAGFKMNGTYQNTRHFRKNTRTRWVILKNAAWVGEDEMPQFSYDSNTNTKTDGYFIPRKATLDTSTETLTDIFKTGYIPKNTTLDTLFTASNQNSTGINFGTIVDNQNIKKFHLPHFTTTTLYDQVIDNDAITGNSGDAYVWDAAYTYASTSDFTTNVSNADDFTSLTYPTEYNNKEYNTLVTIPDITAPVFDSSGGLNNTIPYAHYLTTTDTNSNGDTIYVDNGGVYFGYFLKKYNLGLTVEETGTGTNIYTVKTVVNNNYRYYEARIPAENEIQHYRYFIHCTDALADVFARFALANASGSWSGNGQGWYTLSTRAPLNAGVSEILGEFDLSTANSPTFNDVNAPTGSDSDLRGNTSSRYEIGGKETKIIPLTGFYPDSSTPTLHTDVYSINNDSQLTPYRADHEEGKVLGMHTFEINWESHPLNSSSNVTGQYHTGWGYPFLSNGGDVTLSNLSVRGNMAALGNSYIKNFYAGTAGDNTAPPLLVTNLGTSLATTPLNYYHNSDDQTNSTPAPFLTIDAADKMLELKNEAKLDVQTDDDSSSSTTGAVVVAGGVGIAKKLNVGSDSHVEGDLTVTGATTIKGTLGVTAATTLDSTLGVSGVTTISSTAQADGAGIGALLVSGGVEIAKKLYVGEATTLSSNLGVTGNSTLNGTLGVTGVTTISNETDVSGQNLTQGALVVSGGVAITKKLNVGSDAHVEGDLTVTGGTTVEGALGVTGNSTLNGTLGVVGVTSLSNELNVQSGALKVPNSTGSITMTRDLLLSSNKITCQNIEVKGTMTTINTEEINIKDNHILLNSTHTGTSDQDSGIVSVAKASNTILCTIDSTTTNKLVEVNSGDVTAANFSTGDIILVTSTATNGDNTDKNNGLYVVHNPQGVDGAVTVKNTGINNIDFCREGPFDATVAGSTQYNVSKVSVHHMYFDTDSTNGNSIKYGYGEKEADFEGYGYLDLTQGDVRSSFEEANLNSADHTLTKSITRVTQITGSNELKLPGPTDSASKLVDGTTYKVINSTTSSVTIRATGQDDLNGVSTNIAVELGDDSTSQTVELYRNSTITLTYANCRWYVL